jgi:tetratricopeptide (TPR) repeat protein
MKIFPMMLWTAAALWGGGLSAATPEEEADALFAEPRTLERVVKSVKTCEAALAKGQDADLLWRAARGAAWLARHGPEKERRAQAERGMELSRDAARAAPAAPEGYFYYGMTLGLISRIDRTSRYIERIERIGKKLIEVDRKYAYGGGDRLVGLIYLNTYSYPFVGVGSLKEAETHLRRACELFPEYGYNQLSHAKALIEDDKKREARRALEKVIASKPPPGESEDHAEWVAEARKLLRETE